MMSAAVKLFLIAVAAAVLLFSLPRSGEPTPEEEIKTSGTNERTEEESEPQTISTPSLKEDSREITPVLPNVRPAVTPAAIPKPSLTPALSVTPEPTPLSTPAPELPRLSDQEIYERYSKAVIQIFCKGEKETFSASGVIVNSRGLVLTNAHVAGIVKRVGESSCQARRDNPASPFGKITVVFQADTAKKITDTEVPQRDVAFLKISEASRDFTFADLSLENAREGETLLTLGYPSEFLASISAELNSNLVFSVLRVDGFTDIDGEKTTAEGYVFRGGLALQQGSSGTALVNRQGKVVGLIFATTKAKTTDDRQGIGLMVSYINKIMQLETGQDLEEFIAAN